MSMNVLSPFGIVPNPLFEPASNAFLGGWVQPLALPAVQPFTGSLRLRIWDVEHGACAMLHHVQNGIAGRLAMIDSGNSAIGPRAPSSDIH